ncbi:unnamed protein product, partial [Staurois parvus]
MGTGGWHWWAQVGTGGCIAGHIGRTVGHRWVHCWAQVGALLGIGGRIAGHRWAHCWAQVGALLGTSGRNLCVAQVGTDHQGTDDLSDPDGSDSVRKVQLRTGICISRRSACHWTRL